MPSTRCAALRNEAPRLIKEEVLARLELSDLPEVPRRPFLPPAARERVARGRIHDAHLGEIPGHSRRNGARLRAEQPLRHFLSREVEVRGHVAEDGAQGPEPEGAMVRHRDMVLPALRGREADVAPRLPRDPVAEALQCLREPSPREVARKPQAGMTSSRTKWSRMILGAWPGSK